MSAASTALQQETPHLGASAPNPPKVGTATQAQGSLAALSALCALARFHQVAADPATLAHQLGLTPNQALTVDDLLLAAKHLGLKAKRSSSSVDRLGLLPLPALALMRTEDATENTGLHVVHPRPKRWPARAVPRCLGFSFKPSFLRPHHPTRRRLRPSLERRAHLDHQPRQSGRCSGQV